MESVSPLPIPERKLLIPSEPNARSSHAVGIDRQFTLVQELRPYSLSKQDRSLQGKNSLQPDHPIWLHGFHG